MSKIWEIVITAVISAGLGALGTFYVFNSQLQNLTGKLEAKADALTLGTLDGKLTELSKAIDRGKIEEIKADVARIAIQQTNTYLREEGNVAPLITPTVEALTRRMLGERLDKDVQEMVNKIAPELIRNALEKELKPSVARYNQEAFQNVSSQLQSKIDQAHSRISAVEEIANRAGSLGHAINNIHAKTRNGHAFNDLRDYLRRVNGGNSFGFGDQ